MLNPSFKRQRPFIILTFLILTIFILDRSVQEGLFLDGLVYAGISRNMAAGDGSFWIPHHGGASPFWTHPPLMFGLQAIFFKIFGAFWGTEKIFSFVIWLITSVLIARCWIQISSDHRFRYFFWLPVLLWGFMPSVLWAYPNNILDTTMAVFDIAAVLILHGGLKKGIRMPRLFIGSLFIFAAVMTKGLAGLFPLIVPLLYWLAYKGNSLRKTLQNCAILLGFVAAYTLLLWLFPQPRAYMSAYFNWQLLSSLDGQGEVPDLPWGRFSVLQMLLVELSIVAAAGIVVLALSYLLKTGRHKLITPKSHALFFALIGISASVPLLVSLKIRSFYTVPSLPYFAISASILLYPYLSPITKRITLRKWQTHTLHFLFLLAAIISGILLYNKAGTIGRDHQLIEEVKRVADKLPKGAEIASSKPVMSDYTFMAYLLRNPDIDGYFEIDMPKSQYVITQEEDLSRLLRWQAYIYKYKVISTDTRFFIYYRADSTGHSTASLLPDKR